MSATPVPVLHSGIPASQTGALAPAAYVPSAAASYSPRAEAPASGGDAAAQLGRLKAALSRYRWLIAALIAVGTVGGVVATRLIDPVYQVGSTILITAPMTAGQAANDNRGPIRQEQIFDTQGWMDLLKSFAITDAVVMKLGLYVEPKRSADTVALRGFQLNAAARGFRPGDYTFQVKGGRWTLRDAIGLVNESGVLGDSVGRSAGFAWVPGRAEVGGDRTVKFTVHTPRETSVEIQKRATIDLKRGSNVIVMQLTGTPQEKPAETLNEWGQQFTRVATEIKAERLAQQLKTLTTQRADAEQRLVGADRAFEDFRVGAIALPSEALAIHTGAGQMAVKSDPVMDNYFANKYQLETVHRDREQMEKAMTGLVAGRAPGGVPVEALLAVSSVANDPAASPLRTLLGEVSTREAEIRVLRRSYQDVTPPLKNRLEELTTLEGTTVPQAARDYLGQLRQRETLLEGVVAKATTELKAIPTRTARQESLNRESEGAKSDYDRLDARFRDTDLAQRSLTPDVRVLDRAVMPLDPVLNTAPRIIGVGIAAGLGLGVLLAFLLDRTDRRFRYPSQATNELGLQILGVVPQVDQGRRQSPERVAQIVESFRAIRMNVRYAIGSGSKITLTVTSPGPHDGKSLVASNLALSFGEGGWRTVLIDGDLRRGQLHETFGLSGGPGLIEYLEGTSLLSEVVQNTTHDNLSVIATGTKHRRGPELLSTPRMSQLIAALANEFDAVIVDTPPLGAGTDAYALGTATTHMALVLRRAATDVRMAKAKLDVLDQLPVQVLGVVLNEVEAGGGMYQYFSYDPDYVLVEEGEPARAELAAGA